MTLRQAIVLCTVLTVLLSLPSLQKIPTVLPLYTSAEVRRAAPQALDQLRAQGLWLVNVEFERVEQRLMNERINEICFLWTHRYSRRGGKDPAEHLTTCVDET